MFELSTVDAAAADTAHEHGGRVCVAEWKDPNGAVQARAYVGDAWNWIVWGDIATYRFRRGATTIEALPANGVSLETVTDLYRRRILPIVLQASGLEAIHASAVRGDQGILGFCGDASVGKSTIAYALSRRGYRQYADDVLVMDAAHARIEALYLPFVPRLRPSSAEFFGKDTHADWLARRHTGRHPVAAFFILNPEQSGPAEPEISQLSDVDALRGLLAHAQRFDLTDLASRKRHLQNYLEIALAIPVFSIRYTFGFDRLDALLNVVTRVAEAPEGTALCQAS